MRERQLCIGNRTKKEVCYVELHISEQKNKHMCEREDTGHRLTEQMDA